MLAHMIRAVFTHLLSLSLSPFIVRNFVLKHRVFLLRNWEKMREKQELLKREGERERDAGSLSIYTRWGGVIRDDGNIKSGERGERDSAGNIRRRGWREEGEKKLFRRLEIVSE